MKALLHHDLDLLWCKMMLEACTHTLMPFTISSTVPRWQHAEQSSSLLERCRARMLRFVRMQHCHLVHRSRVGAAGHQ